MNKKILLSAIIVYLLLTGCAKEGMPQQIGQSSSAPTITSSSVPSESAVSSTSTASNSSTSSGQLKLMLAKNTTNQIEFFQSFTIGGNQNAAFAMAGGDVWYITASGAQKLKGGIESPGDNQSDAPVLWIVGDIKIFKCENDPGDSSSASYAWYVKDRKPIELSYTGMYLSYICNGQFTTRYIFFFQKSRMGSDNTLLIFGGTAEIRV